MDRAEKHATRRVEELGGLPLMMTIGQAARLLNVSDKHVRDLCKSGEIRAVRVGNAWRIGRDALLAQYGLAEALTEPVARKAPAPDMARPLEIVVRIELPRELAEAMSRARVEVSSA